MSTINNLQDISIDKIETDIMSVLYANTDTKFSQYTLFNKILEDKYDGQYSSQIHSNFKTRFLLVLRNLMSKYDDIKVTKDNEVYWVVCVSESIGNTTYTKPVKFVRWDKEIKKPISLDSNDFAQMYNYLYEFNQTDFVNWSDPWNGNTIYHELVIFQNKSLIEKLLLDGKFNFVVKNNHGKTPLEVSKNTEISNLLGVHLILELNRITDRIKFIEEHNKREFNNYETKVKMFESRIKTFDSIEYKNKIIYNSSIKDILIVKSKKYYDNYKLYILSAFICFAALKIFYSI